jgi:hypothetical protein
MHLPVVLCFCVVASGMNIFSSSVSDSVVSGGICKSRRKCEVLYLKVNMSDCGI